MFLKLSTCATSLVALAALLIPCSPLCAATPGSPIRVVIVGLVHDHALGLLHALPESKSAVLVGIAEPDTALAGRYAARFHLDQKLFFTDAEKMLEQLKPDAVLVYTDIQDHRKVIEMAAKRGISSMVEKPLATSVEDAIAIRKAAEEHHVEVLVNYETTWYASNAEAYRDAEEGKLGQIRRVVVHDGHEGPKEIGVSDTFLGWLTDPEKNGAGAMFDFGCYGADLMTLIMHGETPLSVTAVALQDKPDIYPKVEDDATIIIRYPKAQAVLQPSWAWTFARKDMEVYGDKGYVITEAADHLRTRLPGENKETEVTAVPLKDGQQDSLDYLAGVLHGTTKPEDGHGDLSSLKVNMVVMQILDAARKSAKEGRTIELKPLAD